VNQPLESPRHEHTRTVPDPENRSTAPHHGRENLPDFADEERYFWRRLLGLLERV